jgi:hypothetical protein
MLPVYVVVEDRGWRLKDIERLIVASATVEAIEPVENAMHVTSVEHERFPVVMIGPKRVRIDRLDDENPRTMAMKRGAPQYLFFGTFDVNLEKVDTCRRSVPLDERRDGDYVNVYRAGRPSFGDNPVRDRGVKAAQPPMKLVRHDEPARSWLGRAGGVDIYFVGPIGDEFGVQAVDWLDIHSGPSVQ